MPKSLEACIGSWELIDQTVYAYNPSIYSSLRYSFAANCYNQKENCNSMFTPKTPHFYKIILEATIKEKALGIPKQFVKKYGKGLSSSVLLTVPSGDTWRVHLTKSDDGVVWLQDGWQEFVEFYSIKYGHFLVFKYEGNGKFLVLIFGMSASEIEYPCKSQQVCLKPVKEEAKDDTCNETLYETPTCKETRKRGSQSQRSNPRKKLKTTQMDKYVKDCEDFSNDEDDLQTKVPKVGRAYGPIEFEKALQRANAFKSENPFFMVTMQPYYIDPGRKMCIPKDFTMKFLKKTLGDVTLCTSDGKTWPARYHRYTAKTYTKSLIHVGWKKFMEDNKLEAGDICVFELISQTAIVLKVVIFRVRQDSSCCSPSGEINSLNTGGNVSALTPGNTDSSDQCWMRPMTPNEKALAILKANFRSKNPFFKVVMQPRYLTIRCSLSIPYKFVMRYLNEDKDEAILQVSDGSTWVVKFSVKIFSDGQPKAEFSDTWRDFAQDNNLQVGDVCVFEVINRDKNLLKVSIFSDTPGANSSLSPQVANAKVRQVASKNCLIPRIEADDDSGNCYAGNSSSAAKLTTIGYQENEEEVNPTDDARGNQVASKNCLVPKIEAADDFANCYGGNSSHAAQFIARGCQETEEDVKPTIFTRPRDPRTERTKGKQRLQDCK